MCEKKVCHCKIEEGDTVVCVNDSFSSLVRGEEYVVYCVTSGGLISLSIGKDVGCYYPHRFRKVCDTPDYKPEKMEIGKEYHYNGATTVARCVGFDGDYAIMRYDNYIYPDRSNEKYSYKRRKGKIGEGYWQEYKEPVVVEKYTSSIRDGHVTCFSDVKLNNSKLKLTFTDGELTAADVI